MSSQKIKVKIINQVWVNGITKNYPDKIDNNNIVLVEDYPDAEKTDYRLVGTHYGIPKKDCEVVEETKEDFKWHELEDKRIKEEYLPDSLHFEHIEGTYEYKLNRQTLGICSASPDDIYLFDGLDFTRKNRIAIETPELDDDLKEITAHASKEPQISVKHFMRDYYDPMKAKLEKEWQENWQNRMEEYSRTNAPIDGVYQFDKEKLERLSKLQTPTDNQTFTLEDMKNAFEQSRLTHPMFGFKHDNFEEYIEYRKKYGNL